MGDYRVTAAFTVLTLKGRRIDSAGEIQFRYAAVTEWVNGVVVRDTNYTDIDDARAAPERLAAPRE